MSKPPGRPHPAAALDPACPAGYLSPMPEPALYDEGPFAPCPAPFNMAAHTLAAADATPGKVALEVLDAPGHVAECWTYRALADAVCRTAGGLAARGLRPGDRLLLRLGNSADFPILFFAANALGAVPVPVSSQLTAAELAPIIDDLAPTLIAHDTGLPLPPVTAPVLTDIAALRRHPAVPFAATAPDDPAYIILTSGTGARPKGVVHAQRAAWARRMMWDGWYGLTAQDRVLHAGAFNWTYTLGAGLTDPWAIGATALIYVGPPDRGVWPALAAAHRPTIFAAAPGIYRQMLGTPGLGAAFASLRHGLTAGEALADAVRAAWETATGKPIHEALGMSEISTYISSSPARPGPYPQPGRRIAILPDESGDTPVSRGSDGLLAVSRRDPGLMLGYWRQPADHRRRFPRRMVRHRRPRAHGGRRRRHPPRPRRRPHQRRRLPRQPARGRDRPRHPPRRRRGRRLRAQPPPRRLDHCRRLRPPRRPGARGDPRPPLRRAPRTLQMPQGLRPRRRPAAELQRQAPAPPAQGDQPVTRLEVISDPVCPWCYLGAANLTRALADHPGPHPLALTWRPYQLDPTLPPEGADRAAYLAAKFPDPAAIDAAHDRLTTMAAESGITFDFDRITRAPNTLDAHRVIRWAEPDGLQTRTAMALFRRYFERGEDISDPAILTSAAAEAGLDAGAIARLLQGDADRETLRAEADAAREMGVTGVPTFILGGRYAISGAQPVAFWTDLVAKIEAAA